MECCRNARCRQKKRNGGSTFCEIIAPLVVVGFLVALSKNKEVPTATFECGMQSTHGGAFFMHVLLSVYCVALRCVS